MTSNSFLPVGGGDAMLSRCTGIPRLIAAQFVCWATIRNSVTLSPLQLAKVLSLWPNAIALSFSAMQRQRLLRS
jgi:hypothetical protein